MKAKTDKVKIQNKYRLLFKIILFLIMPTCLLFWLWYNYLYQPKDVYVIYASKLPFKVEAKNKINYQDNSYYDSIYKKTKIAPKVKFSPLPEKSLKTEKNFGIDELSEIIDNVNLENSLQPEYIQAANSNNELIITTTHKIPTKLLSIAKSSRIKLLLGSFGSNLEAINSWNNIQNEHNKIIYKYTYEIEVNNSQPHAVYNLLLIGVKNTEDGYRLCKNFTQKNQPCILLE